MATYTWAVGTSGNWEVVGNWTGGLLFPGPADDALINQPGTYTVTSNSTAEAVNALTLNAAAATLSIQNALALNSTLTVQAGTLELRQAHLTGPGAITNNGLLTGVSYASYVDLGGPVTNNGQITVANAGDKLVIARNFVNAGSVVVNAGSFSVDGVWDGSASGTVTISGGAHFGLGGDALGSNSFVFGSGTGNAIDFDVAQTVVPVVKNMQVGDYLELATANPASTNQPTFDGSTLTYSDGTKTWKVTMQGVPANSRFVAFTDPASINGGNGIDIGLAPSNVPHNDFNGDGSSDIVWQNSSGLIYQWQMNGTAVATGAGVANLDSSWHFLGTGDFNADNRADMLWQNSSGLIYQWQMNGAQVIGGGGVGNLDSSWHFLGTGDFNGDGKSDILWQNNSGLIYDWQMDGTTVVNSSNVASLDSSWHFLATGDFNGDGKSDILWQNDSGLIYEWQMNGNQVTAGGGVGNLDRSQWSLIGTAEFNGDGKTDLLWQNTSGLIYEWQMNGTQVASGGGVSILDRSQWSLLGTGDYNRDGKTDLLWQNSGSGLVYEWQMNGTQVAAGGGIANLDSSWHHLA